MKPVLLKIQGVNSFLDEQTIDFESLLKYGLFGIFGKTGSGKTTILDAITLALYGQIPRYSSGRKEFINSRTTTAYVYFEFQIETINYVVERRFKLNNARYTESSSTLFYKKKSNDEVEILGDKITDTNNKIESLIGLSYTDFTRIVVLPQGKFSDFLLLANRDRNEMLERIFGLEEYGEGFAKRIRQLKSKEEADLELIEKQLEIYDGVSKKRIKEVTIAFDETEVEIQNLKEIIANLNNKLLTEKEFEKNFNDLDLFLEKKNILLAKENEIKEKEILFSKSKNAKIVYPIVENIISIESDLSNTKILLDELQKLLNKKETQLITLKENYETAKNNKKDNEPLYIEKIHKLKDALSYEEKLNLAISKKDLLTQKENTFINNLTDEKKQLNIFQEEINKHNVLLSEINNRKKEIYVSSNFRTNIDLGFKTLEKISENQKSLNSKKDNINTKSNSLLLNNEKTDLLTKELEDLLNEIDITQNKINSLNENKINSSELVSLNKEIMQTEHTFLEKTEIRNSLSSLKEKLQKKNELVSKTNEALNLLKENNNETKENLYNINLKIATQEKENLVNIIARDLHAGDECPICGSEIKHLNIIASKEIESLELEKSNFENKIQKLDKEITTHNITSDLTFREIEDYKTKIADCLLEIDGYIFEEEELKIQNSNTTLNNKTIQKGENENELKLLEEKIKTFENSKKEKEILNATLNVNISFDNNFILETGKEILDLESKMSESKKIILDISATNNITNEDDYYSWHKKIKDFDLENENLNTKLEETENLITDKKNSFDKTKDEIIALEKNISNIKTGINGLVENISEYTEKIKSLADNKDLKSELANTKNSLNNLREEEKNSEEAFFNTQDELQKTKNKNIETKNNLENLEKNLTRAQNSLDTSLKEYNFETTDEVKNYLLTELEQKEILGEVENYKKDYSIVLENITILKNKTENLNREEIIKSIIENQKTVFESTNNLEEETKNLGGINAELNLLKENIVKVNSLLENKNKSNYQLDLLTELATLFRGNGFVKFITKNQLEYITFEASKRFKQMTKNRYAFELDDTNFIIRDDYNNGLRRSPQTLSGGETFIASLCLALALSSKIQLNNKHPLEFFFLDEGFGTLDSSSLDEVISSLADLQKESINIGIISHSENVKERIPVRLLVTAPNDFEGGSVVKFEIS